MEKPDLRPDRVSRNEKITPENWKQVGMAVIQYQGTGVGCNCGWAYAHAREKVREDAIDRHLNKRHNGRGIRI